MHIIGFRQAKLHQDAADVLLTVPSVTHSFCAIPLFERPSAISARTSRSLGDSTSSGSSAWRAVTSSATRAGSTTEAPRTRRFNVSTKSSTSMTRLFSSSRCAGRWPGDPERARPRHARRGQGWRYPEIPRGSDGPLRVLQRSNREAFGCPRYQLRLLFAHQGKQQRRVCTLPNDVEARALKQARETLAQQDVVVCQRDPDPVLGHLTIVASFRTVSTLEQLDDLPVRPASTPHRSALRGFRLRLGDFGFPPGAGNEQPVGT